MRPNFSSAACDKVFDIFADCQVGPDTEDRNAGAPFNFAMRRRLSPFRGAHR